MLAFYQSFLFVLSFIPHGHCYLWQPQLIGLHSLSDSLTALTYYAIAFSLFYFVRKRCDVPFQKVFWLFGALTIACGTIHLMEVWTLWHPVYWLSGYLKALTTAIAIYTAIELIPLLPQALALPSPAQIELANQALSKEVAERQRAEIALQQANEQLEIRIEERTAQLKQKAHLLLVEILKSHQAQEALQESEQQFRAVFESAMDAMVIVDDEGQYVAVNPAAGELFALPLEELLSRYITDFTETGFDFAQAWQSFQERGRERGEFRLVRLDGTTRDVEYTATANFLPNRHLACLRDVTERKRIEEELEQHRQLLEERVSLRTSELREANEQLRQEIRDRQLIEAALYQREQEFRALVENSPDLIVRFDRELRHVYVSPAVERVSGIPPQAFIGKTNRDLGMPDQKVTYWEKGMHQAFQTGCEQVMEFDFITPSGLRYYQARLVPELSAEGLVESLLCVTRDITERVNAEKALRESEERFRKIFAEAPIGMALASRDGQLRQVNQALCKMLGYTEAELKTLTFRDITYPADLEKELPYIEKCAKGEITSYQIEKRYFKKTGNLLLTHLTCGMIYDSVGKTHYGLAMIEDITQRKQVEKMKDEFISVVSHELRTPLTSLRGALGLLSTGRLGQLCEKGQQMLEFALADTERLTRLVNDILDLERLKSGKITLTRQVCHSADLIGRVVDLMEPIAQKAEVTLSVVPDFISVWADCDRILQVLTNLLGNAIKFSPPGSTIRLSAQRQGHLAVFQVQDQGRGIPTEQLRSIFEPFQQVDASDSRQRGGTGLGLAICHSLVQEHGGTIWAESTLGQGSTFTFTLPMQLEE